MRRKGGEGRERSEVLMEMHRPIDSKAERQKKLKVKERISDRETDRQLDRSKTRKD